MKTINEFSPHIKHVLEEMCSVVDADPTEIDFNSNNWFWEYSWTAQQEKDFIAWLTGYLYDDRDARREIMEYPRKNKKSCRKVAEFFVWNHGWKTI